MALFGEKYGDRVRVCKIGDFSYELCGGTHIENTGKIGLFKIISEASVSSGVRRIEAVTGYGILDLIEEYRDILNTSAAALKITNVSTLPQKCEAITEELRKVRNDLKAANEKAARSQLSSMFDGASSVGDFKVATAVLADTDSICDDIRAKFDSFVAVLVAVDGDKATLHTVCSQNAVKAGAHAGKIVGEIAGLTAGKGGGKPESATAGVGDITKINSALNESLNVVSKYIG